MYSYLSTAWILVRGAWFFDFKAELLRLMVTKRDMSFKKIGQKAYDEELKQHHNWFLKQLASIGLVAISSRESFIKSFLKE